MIFCIYVRVHQRVLSTWHCTFHQGSKRCGQRAVSQCGTLWLIHSRDAAWSFACRMLGRSWKKVWPEGFQLDCGHVLWWFVMLWSLKDETGVAERRKRTEMTMTEDHRRTLGQLNTLCMWCNICNCFAFDVLTLLSKDLKLQILKFTVHCRILIAELVPSDLGPKRAATTGSGLAIINTEPWMICFVFWPVWPTTSVTCACHHESRARRTLNMYVIHIMYVKLFTVLSECYWNAQRTWSCKRSRTCSAIFEKLSEPQVAVAWNSRVFGSEFREFTEFLSSRQLTLEFSHITPSARAPRATYIPGAVLCNFL